MLQPNQSPVTNECFNSHVLSSVAVLMSEAEQFRGRSGDVRSDCRWWCHRWWCHGVRSGVARLMWRTRIGDKAHAVSHLIIREVPHVNEMTSPLDAPQTDSRTRLPREKIKSSGTRAKIQHRLWQTWAFGVFERKSKRPDSELGIKKGHFYFNIFWQTICRNPILLIFIRLPSCLSNRASDVCW